VRAPPQPQHGMVVVFVDVLYQAFRISVAFPSVLQRFFFLPQIIFPICFSIKKMVVIRTSWTIFRPHELVKAAL
jgi:hypothetical protein